MKGTTSDSLKKEPKIFDCVSRIAEARTLEEVKAGVTAFIEFAEANAQYRNSLYEQLRDLITKTGWSYLYEARNKKVMYIPPEDAPLLLIPTCGSTEAGADMFFECLKRFLTRCGDFTEPIEERITEDEMKAVLRSAQRKFKIMDIIASEPPLRIVSLNNSHRVVNSECGIGDGYMSVKCVIMVYNPRSVKMFDRVFIFAHEIGHALHLALTGDKNKLPDGFGKFNERFGLKDKSVNEEQEMFADAVAIAVLNSGVLKEHLPKGVIDSLPWFDEYIREITSIRLPEFRQRYELYKSLTRL